MERKDQKKDSGEHKKKNWYSVGVIDDKFDGTGKDSLKIIEKARQLDIDTYRSQAQGSVFYYIHCTQTEADKLISVLGKEKYACGILDEDGVKLLKLIKPQMVHKSKEKKPDEKKDSKNDNKKTKSLDDQLQEAIFTYNDAYTILNDHGIRLFNQRERAVDLLEHIEGFINSIANKPKEFDTVIAQIQVEKKQFRDACIFAKKELNEARKSAVGAGAGVAGGMAVASLAPSAAMWIATTFGTASTGTAISTLSGAVATKAALAWLGGGAIAAGGGGVAAGNALLALAGPVGWGIAGASLLTSIILFRNKKMKLDKEKKDEIKSVHSNTEQIKETDAKIDSLLKKTVDLRRQLNDQYHAGLIYYNMDYLAIPEGGQLFLGAVVNNAKALSASLSQEV
jgi:hypothetical protein